MSVLVRCRLDRRFRSYVGSTPLVRLPLSACMLLLLFFHAKQLLLMCVVYLSLPTLIHWPLAADFPSSISLCPSSPSSVLGIIFACACDLTSAWAPPSPFCVWSITSACACSVTSAYACGIISTSTSCAPLSTPPTCARIVTFVEVQAGS